MYQQGTEACGQRKFWGGENYFARKIFFAGWFAGSCVLRHAITPKFGYEEHKFQPTLQIARMLQWKLPKSVITSLYKSRFSFINYSSGVESNLTPIRPTSSVRFVKPCKKLPD